MKRTSSPMKQQSGFSIVELLVAFVIFVVIIAVAFAFFVDFSRNAEAESQTIEMQQAARVAVDELARSVQQAGFGITRTDPYNAASWQRAVVHAGAHTFAYNANVDSDRGAVRSSESIEFPGGEVYSGEGSGSTKGAETYVYTIDANDDGVIDLSDRAVAATGSFNPAADTPNPLDFAVFRRVYGWDGSATGGDTSPVAGHLFTNATSAVEYLDGSKPSPLFTYWLAEDLDGNGNLADSECVVTPCPPSSTRAPKLYLWGDDDFDGVLSDAEKDALRDLPVGSPDWDKNAVVTSGNFISTTTSAAIDPAANDAYEIKVADATGFGVGQHIVVTDGTASESLVIDFVDKSSSPHEISVLTNPKTAFASGATVETSPDTLLRAIRTVQINYDAISPDKVIDATTGQAPVGKAGRAGTRGLDYAVRSFQRKVELPNQETSALIKGSGAANSVTCPLSIDGVCSGSVISEIQAVIPRPAPIPITFFVSDGLGNAKPTVFVTFANTNPSLGTLNLVSAASDNSGFVTVEYTPNGVMGTDTIKATASCLDESGTVDNITGSVSLKLVELRLTLDSACLPTVGPSTPIPATSFTAELVGEDGPVASVPITFSLEFDPGFVDSPPNFSTVSAELVIDGNSAGVTDPGTGVLSFATNTGSGSLTGSVHLNQEDLIAPGTKLALRAEVPDSGCTLLGGSAFSTVQFVNLAVASKSPDTNCTEAVPCELPPESPPAQVEATVSINGQPVPNADVTFTAIPIAGPPDAGVILGPSSGWKTNSSGVAGVAVMTTDSASITPSDPLIAAIDATSTGGCSGVAVGNGGSRAGFEFHGPTAGCEIEMNSAWVTQLGKNKDQFEISVKNAGDVGDCPVKVTGVQLTVLSGGLPDAAFTISKIEGGAISDTPGTAGKGVVLFEKACNGNQNLPNGTKFTFVDMPKCKLPTEIPGGKFMEIDKITFTKDVGGQKPDKELTIRFFYECAGGCTGGSEESQELTVTIP